MGLINFIYFSNIDTDINSNNMKGYNKNNFNIVMTS